jgi:hypothetical protein
MRADASGGTWQSVKTGLLAAGLCLAGVCPDRLGLPLFGLADRTFAQTQQPRHPYPLAGKLTIDGQPPGKDGTVIVMLDGPTVVGKIEPYYAYCRPDGSFEFQGGHSAGRFVITIAWLRERKGVEWAEFLGPDRLKNLYNDPDRNAKRPEFVIRHEAPGKTNYRFNLKVAGERPVQPGPNAVTHLEFE